MNAAKIAFAALIVAYPVIVYFGLDYMDARMIALILILMAMARLFLAKRMNGAAGAMPQSNWIVAALLLVGILALISNSVVLLQYYPVCMNVLMFILFFTSLLRPPSIIERIARLKTPDLPEAGIAYTRKVTMVWCGFFIINGSMALYTVLGTGMGFWALYNGLISYSLMGLLFAGEYLVRRQVQRTNSQSQGAKGWS
ncbi:MAG: hypothetical protein HOM58_18955 [Rhodospirillaceae bacterium]|jgi:uncharacterized membrane protein|nr:hypothetical protein [Rhodospirillaceae bacterium]MBT5457187.1 hypothetical protein [Rhodospirillaceae bacterium]